MWETGWARCRSRKRPGRSFHDGHPATQPSDVRFGYNFAEQWERAIKEDPQLVFVTGWNEWTAMRLDRFNGIRTPPMFVDEFDQEHSRDISRCGAATATIIFASSFRISGNKGERPIPKASGAKTIESPAIRATGGRFARVR